MRTNGQPGKFWEIWSEGYSIPGYDRVPAQRHGMEWGVTFLEACRKLAKVNNSFALNFCPRDMKYWNVDLYPVDPDTNKRIFPEELEEMETYFKAWKKAKEELG